MVIHSIQTQWRAMDGLTYRYAYDKTGNLVKDRSEEIAEIRWCASGKVKEIIRTQGSVRSNLLLAKSNEEVETDLTMYSRALGEKRYELTNHLGNVLAVVSDKRNGDEPDVVSVSKLRISLENQRKQNFLTDFLVFSRKSEYSF